MEREIEMVDAKVVPGTSGLPAPRSAEQRPAFTVFTATYNRRGLLPRVYDSLRAQTFTDFEWLIVDDASTDGSEELVRHWQATASFPIDYQRQERAGKHAATNHAILAARGEFFLVLDSDDECVPRALERLLDEWQTIPVDQREDYVGVTALCMDAHGRIIGTRFKREMQDARVLEAQFRFKMKGEKWGFQRVDVLRKFLFPVTRDYVGCVPEALVWNEISLHYKTRYLDEALRIYHTDAEDTDAPQLTRGSPESQATGQLLYRINLLNRHIRWARYAPREFAVAAAHYSRFSFHEQRGLVAQWHALENIPARAFWALTLPAGLLAYRADRGLSRGLGNRAVALARRAGLREAVKR